MDQDEENKNNSQKDPLARAGEDQEKCKKERDEYLAGWQRAKADFINYKKDEATRLQDIIRYGNEGLIKELITVMDNFDFALRMMEGNRNTAPTPAGDRSPDWNVGTEKGMYMIRSQMEDMLRRHGVERIEIKVGDHFNPAISETIAEVESEKPPGTIVEEIEAGYRLYDKILRPARVKISKGQKT